jgi:Cu-Zn family superoxide dismutase
VRRALILTTVLATSLLGEAGAAAPDRYVLPGATVFPEGVAVRPGSDDFFVSSTQDGTIFRGRLGRSRTEVYLGPGAAGLTTAVGLKATRDRLIIAGGVLNHVDVWDLRNGHPVRRFTTESGGLVNDVAIAPNGDAYVTDSRRGFVFRIAGGALARRHGPTPLRPFVRVSPALAPEGYTNGIVVAGRRYLVVSVTTAGLLRIDLRTKRVTRVRLTAGAVPAGDGMALRGRTLYVVNSGSRVAQVALSRDLRRGRVVRQITSPSFRFPTTVAIAGKRLLVVNSQFDKRGGTPELPFTVSSVARPSSSTSSSATATRGSCGCSRCRRTCAGAWPSAS